MDANFVLLSGCAWNDCGGAQRPPALARELMANGARLAFYGARPSGPPRMGHENLTVLNNEQEALEWARGREPGWVIISLPTYWPTTQALQKTGWRVCYDLLDDWGAFVDYGDLPASILRCEATIFACADRVVCSAPALLQRARVQGRDDAALVLNGGPAKPIEHVGGGPVAVYAGYLFGSWFDWQILGELEARKVETIVIGRYDNVPDWQHVTFVGEKPWAEALAIIATAQVGIIPFRHNAICEAVDPIKAYDYWAAGLWVVATPALSALEGRPYTVFAERGRFAETVLLAAESRNRLTPGEEFVRLNSWAERAKALEEVLLSPPMSRGNEVSAIIPDPLTPESSCQLRVTWQAPVRCDMEPSCPYCNNSAERSAKCSDMPGTADEWFRAFARLADSGHGPLYLSVCYGEPLADPMTMQVVARLAKFTRIDLVTNLLAAPEALRGIPRNGNVRLCASYHPEAWPDLASFLRRRRQVERTGIACPTVQVVAWPPYLDRLDAWASEAATAGAAFGILPFWGEHEGKSYPDAYDTETTCWQAEPVTRRCGDRWLGKPCRAGQDYLFVGYDGEVYRCVMPSRSLGNLLRGDVRLLTEPEACPSERCSCPDLWRLQETGA